MGHVSIVSIVALAIVCGADPPSILSRHPRGSSYSDCQMQKEFYEFVFEQHNEIIKNLTTVVTNQTRQIEDTKMNHGKLEEMRKQIEVILKAVSKPRDCSMLRSLGYDVDGVYTIFPMGGWQESVEVWCDMTSDGGGWTVFLSRQRQDTPLDFAQTWRAYADGFGTPSGEYWLGNRYLHALTKDGPQLLKLDMKNLNSTSRSAQWSTFAVGDEASKFVLRAEGFSASTLGNVLSRHNGQKFSTMDQDNDASTRASCSELYGRGGWWYRDCLNINPTGSLRTGRGDGTVARTEARTVSWDGISDRTRTAVSWLTLKLRNYQ